MGTSRSVRSVRSERVKITDKRRRALIVRVSRRDVAAGTIIGRTRLRSGQDASARFASLIDSMCSSTRLSLANSPSTVTSGSPTGRSSIFFGSISSRLAIVRVSGIRSRWQCQLNTVGMVSPSSLNPIYHLVSAFVNSSLALTKGCA